MGVYYMYTSFKHDKSGDKMTKEINKIKKAIDNIIKKEHPIYCEVCYDGENEDKNGEWFYAFIIYMIEKKK